MLLCMISYMTIWIAGYLYPDLKKKMLFSPFENLLMLVTGILAFWGVWLHGYESGCRCSEGDSQNNK